MLHILEYSGVYEYRKRVVSKATESFAADLLLTRVYALGDSRRFVDSPRNIPTLNCRRMRRMMYPIVVS